MMGCFSTVYMLQNGRGAYAALEGARAKFSDKRGLAALSRLNAWALAGYFPAAMAGSLWTEGVKELEEGKAAFLLLDGQAMARFSDPDSVSFVMLRTQGKASPMVALGSVTGFVVPAAAKNPEAALALADAWIALGSPGLVDEGERVAVYREKGAPPPPASNRPRSLVARALYEGLAILPPLDLNLGSQAGFDLREVFRGWPSGGFGSAAELKDFASKLDAARGKGR
jgi:hypothetical protein